ncbi:hypothetical protein [uncultured Pseudodesulfovibrio sp.]|uniref:hypothetical protein n=1 Tax=uncultured Pseudodesulfovibrio sp. TaxID=2035858 RepID=UPI0029C6C668|nr:hypothetical protein [uncultured Pseudodesulfovibrio sp.]
MSRTVVNKTLDMIKEGYAPYSGEIDDEVYDRLKCRKDKSRCWFVRATPENVFFVCLGCAKGCSLKNPVGFQAVLPMDLSRSVPVVAGVVPVISDEELLRIKTVLRLDEVMRITRLGETKAREAFTIGEFEVLEGLPLRATSESVRRYLKRTR